MKYEDIQKNKGEKKPQGVVLSRQEEHFSQESPAELATLPSLARTGHIVMLTKGKGTLSCYG